MAIRIIKEVSRDQGRLPATAISIIAGQPLELVDADTVRWYDQTDANDQVLGLASDSNIQQPLQGAGGLTVGVGFDYTNFNRGGLIGAFLNGGVFELYNDGTGVPFTAGDTYNLNENVYAANTGLLTSSGAGDNKLVGTAMKVVGAPVTSLTIKLLI